MPRGRIPSVGHVVRALCSAAVLCWSALFLAHSAAPSPPDSQPSLRTAAVSEPVAFVASVSGRHVAAMDAPRWRAPWPVVPAAPSAQLASSRCIQDNPAPVPQPSVRVGGRMLHGYDAAAPPARA